MIQSIAIKGEDKQTVGREEEKQNKTLDATGHYSCIKDVIKRKMATRPKCAHLSFSALEPAQTSGPSLSIALDIAARPHRLLQQPAIS